MSRPTRVEVGDLHANDVDHVTVDGDRLDYVTVVDEVEGFAEAFDLNDEGKPQLDETGESCKMKVLRGDVRIVWKED